MRGLRPDEYAELSRLLLPPLDRTIRSGGAEDRLREVLVEQGRAQYVAYDSPRFLSASHPRVIGEYTITASGREALRLWPLMQALAAAGTP